MTESILTEQPCAPPCWQGITPGTIVERQTILRRLRRLPGTTNVRADGATIKWIWRKQPGVNAVYIEWDGMLRSIRMFVDFELPIEEIIQKYGPPSAVNGAPFGYGEDTYVILNLYYPQHGLVCRARVLPEINPVLEPDSLIYEIDYTVPADSMEAWFGDHVKNMGLQPWPGYGKLEILGP